MRISLNDVEAALSLPDRRVRSDFDLNPGWAGERVGPPRDAAVLCGLVEREEGLAVVLTRRASHLRAHAGQIAFPGGKIEPEDPSPLDAALREAEEEVGLGADQVDVLGHLDPYHTGTGFRVSPVVGCIAPDWRPVPDPSEVAEVFETPLDFLMDRTNRQRHHYDRHGRRRYFHAMPWGDYYIWGATAGMLVSLSDRLEALRRAA